LGLDGGRGLAGRQLQQERPVAAAPLEERVCVAAFGRVVQVVLPRRNLGQQVPVAASDVLARLRLGDQVGERIPGGDVWAVDVAAVAPLPAAAVAGVG